MNDAMNDTTTIAAFAPLREQLDALRETEKAAQFDYQDPKGNKAARSHVHSLRRVKGDIEKARKAEKAEVLERGRQIDGQAHALVAEVDGMIEPHAAGIARVEAAEEARVQRHLDAIDQIQAMAHEHDPVTGERHGSNYLQDQLATARDLVVDDTFEEFRVRAEAAQNGVIAALTRAVEAAQEREEQEAELARLREEQEARLAADKARAEQEARDRAEREQKERENRAAREAADKAMRDAQEAAERQEREHREELARVKAEAEEREQEAAERREREAAEAQAQRDREERERLEQEARDQAELRRRQEDQEHRRGVNREVVEALVTHAGMEEADARDVVRAIAAGDIPHVEIRY